MRSLQPFRPAAAVWATLLLAGCAESKMAGHLLYMTPYKLEEMDCDSLKKKAINADAVVKRMEGLRDKASASTAGPLVNSMVYGPDYSKARWDQQIYSDEIASKNCNDTPATDAATPPAPAPR